MMSNYIHYKVCDEITYSFLNFNTVEVWEWISNSTPHFTRYVITYPYNQWQLIWRKLGFPLIWYDETITRV